ncbi:hypothetical protein F8M41_025534 [Gigaspora margarita]|uniref:F-box domain-containing protein n=1 Tax=Gigaspora margarita TaxID=4874 RepID=A0A8H4AA29_GIGMA|nr:hypothetical protein F8M41_025534 [Gigaspora margarita]
MIKLPADCLYQIFQHFKDDLKTLHSCLLSSRTCCELIIPILWSNPWKLIRKKKFTPEYKISLMSLLSTLLSCLPSESKQLLHDKHVHWTSHRIFLNYITYCRSLDCHGIWDMLDVVSAQHPLFPFSNSKIHIKNLVCQEICKMIILQSIKITQMFISEKSYSFFNLLQILSLSDSQNLSQLKEFEYEINENSKILTFCNLSNVCKNISNFTIYLRTTPSESFVDFIKSQNSIKFMDIKFKYGPSSKFINSLLLHSNTLTYLYVSCYREISTFSKIFSIYHTFSNLRFLKYHVYSDFVDNGYDDYDDGDVSLYAQNLQSKKMVNISLPNLEILELDAHAPFSYQIIEQIIQGTQGKLEKIYLRYPIYYTNPIIINQSILRSCQNLKVLTTFVTKDTLDIILAILTSCRNLEGFALYSRNDEIYSILNHLSLHPLKNLYNLKFNIIDSHDNFSPKNLELFLKSLEKEELVKKLNISLIYEQPDIYVNSIIVLFETYCLKGIIASYFIEDENYVICEYDDWQRLLM